MKVSQIPFLIVLVSVCFPPIVAFTQSIYLSYSIDFLILIIFILYLIFESPNLPKNFLLWIISPMVIHSFLVITQSKTLGSRGLLSLLITTYIFFIFLRNDNKINQPVKIFNQLKLIYVFLLGALILEGLLRLLGYDNLLFYPISTLNPELAESKVKLYKFYNSNAFFKFLGFDWMTGLNSLLIGSQGASQIVANAIIIFSPIYFRSKINLINDQIILFILSLIIYPFVATMTSNLILVFVFFIALLYLPNSRINNFTGKLSLPLLLIFSSSVVPIIFYRIGSKKDIFIYVNSWISPIKEFMNFSLFNQLFGQGGSFDINATGDFGFGLLLIRLGFVPLAFITIMFFLLFIKTINSMNYGRLKKILDEPWFYLGSVNILCAFSWFTSIGHYTQALELGGRFIFAFHLAISLLFLERSKAISAKDCFEINDKRILDR